MRAIVIRQYGGPEQLDIVERPVPESKPGHVVIAVKAFGLNRAEIYMRSGVWGDVAEISGIECVGTVESDPDGRFTAGQKVAALKCARTSALYRSLIACSTLSCVCSSSPYARTTAAPITDSDTSESISPTRVRAALNAADSLACIDYTTISRGISSTMIAVASCHE